MSILPCFKGNNLVDGSYIRVLPYCQKNFSSGKCKEHYEKLMNSPEGFHMCPKGLSSLVYVSNEGDRVIYSSIRAKGYYDKKKAKGAQPTTNVYNPVLDLDQLYALANEDYSLQQKMISISQKEEEVKDVLHEARKFNGQIKNICDIICDTDQDENISEKELKKVMKGIKDIHVCSYLAFNRFSYYDIVTNPELTFGDPFEVVVFKKFDKMRMMLNGSSKKNVWISLDSQSQYTYKIYPSFETLIFILLENAIKYSPGSRSVNVYFYEEDEILEVEIVSDGPYCNNDELKLITNKGYRGTNAKAVEKGGQGIGLAFAQKIADMHNIEMTFSSDFRETRKKVPYGEFCVKLKFDNNK